VMGHRETAAARFVIDLDLGTVCDYSAAGFQKAVALVTGKETSSAIRNRARALSPKFSCQGLAGWIWDSLSEGRPIDNRFQGLLLPMLTQNTG